jgi:hypothetical protein
MSLIKRWQSLEAKKSWIQVQRDEIHDQSDIEDKRKL